MSRSRARSRLVGVVAAGVAAGGVVAALRHRRRATAGLAAAPGTSGGTARPAPGTSAAPTPARGGVEAVRAAVLRPVEAARPVLEIARAQRLARLGRVSDAVMGLLAVLITLLLGDVEAPPEPDDALTDDALTDDTLTDDALDAVVADPALD